MGLPVDDVCESTDFLRKVHIAHFTPGPRSGSSGFFQRMQVQLLLESECLTCGRPNLPDALDEAIEHGYISAGHHAFFPPRRRLSAKALAVFSSSCCSVSLSFPATRNSSG